MREVGLNMLLSRLMASEASSINSEDVILVRAEFMRSYQ